MEAFTTPIELIFHLGLLLAMAPLIHRILRGPHVLDRIMCVDALALVTICLLCVWNLGNRTDFFFDAVLALAIVGFVSTVALARYLENGDIID